MTPVWNDYMEDRKQLEIDFTSPDQKVASELGIRWAPQFSNSLLRLYIVFVSLFGT